ncbi:putative disease resistance protein RGA3-like isoform X1 [Hibiscus syriacus]|uniref:U-box domain-containing protein n=1 Tax=Hibiscus syriacus TaxID=106335 RepID=A0A6A2WIV2_HIBSY|nr:U-box domain-containing protein 26-like [Hibiscus syriacus]KAE8655915.1 putative disease resistance protein RGA3-like isoform X1 [Hibiscus syriacus]
MEEGEMTIPHLFTCPISLDLFTDPVTLCTGQTYDRSSIQKWLAAGNLTCPVTMQKLHDPSLVPNHNLRHLIQQWREMGHRLHPDYFTTIDPLVSLKHSLSSPSSTFLEKLQALQKVMDLTDETDSLLIEMGFLPLLLKLVFEMVDPGFSQDYVNFVEQGLVCVLRFLPLGELECLNMLKEGSNLESFVVLFERGSMMMKQSLCHIVGLISSSSATRELCRMIGKNQRLLNMVICVVKQNSEISEAGIQAISALCCLESNREKLVQQGLIDGLVTYIWNSEKKERSLAAMAMARIEQVLGSESAKEALIKNPNGVKAVVKMVFRVSEEEGSESAVNSLMKVCEGSLEAREKAIVSGGLTQLLLLLQSQCSGRTKTKATTLLKLL